MKNIVDRIKRLRTAYSIEDTPAYVRFEIERIVRFLSDYSAAFPEYKQDCIEIVELLDRVNERNDQLFNKSGCTLYSDGV